MRLLTEVLAKAATCIIFDCAAAAINLLESIRLTKALLILLLYPALGASLSLPVLLVPLVAVAVGFL